MWKRRRTNTRKPKVKTVKTNAAAAAAANRQVLVAEAPVKEPPIFKLIDDCCYEIFNRLSLKDLYSFGQTCKWAQQVAGNFFQTNYRTVEVEVNANCFTAHGITLNGFGEFFQNVCISHQATIAAFRNFQANCGQSIKQLRLHRLKLSTGNVECLENVLQMVECLKIEGCTMSGDIYRKLLKFCPKLKELCIWDDNQRYIQSYGTSRGDKFETIIGTENAWLRRKYATIEHLELCPQPIQINVLQLETFFKQNPNVQSLAIDAEFFMKNVDFFKVTNMKLDRLTLYLESGENAELACKLVNELHERGVYQKLDLFAPHGLPKEIVSSQALIRSLERVCIGDGIADDILLCMRHAATLKEIKVKPATKKVALDLIAWNAERKRLIGARKVTIFVDEGTFMATKGFTHQTNFELVKLQQDDSHEWHRYFDYLNYCQCHYY